ncbi:TetR/AcrR family transcriptional regulator [uncultured Neglectibacter sp.]|uniref:TetR/AcrR family transcriptional regulator n=1 Tax=uncultured Neglectibacter sp. TaxID=1924108 RepID=UPI0034E013AC
MARNKYPEETVRKILEVSRRLFLEKGYEKTSIQDIVNALGMSKGAIYHHFPSKEALLVAVVDSFYSQEDWFKAIAQDPSKNGLEKLREVFLHEVASEEKLQMDNLYFARQTDPEFFLKNLQLNVNSAAVDISRLIEEGNRDGSLRVDHPLETAEMMMVLFNVWLSLFAESREKFIRMVEVTGQSFAAMGIPLFNEELTVRMLAYYDAVLKHSEIFEKEAP